MANVSADTSGVCKRLQFNIGMDRLVAVELISKEV
jgi:hypothetical protein